MDWKKRLGAVTNSLNQEFRRRNEYLLAENHLLRQQVRGCLLLTDGDRKALAAIGQHPGRKALEAIATVAKADTIFAWNRKFAAPKCDGAKPCTSAGRPRIHPEIEDLVVRMARENRSWGYDRMVGALANLGLTISDQTVGNILKRHGVPPAPERRKTMTWREFIRIHLDVLGTIAFCKSEMGAWLGFVISYVLSYIHLDWRKSYVTSIKCYLNERWILLLWLWSLDLCPSLERWVGLVKENRRSWWGLCGRGIFRQLLSESVSYHYQGHRRRGIGQVVFRPVVNPYAIRDGPISRRQRPGEVVKYDHREAA